MGQWWPRRKVSVILELLSGADLESRGGRHWVTAGTRRLEIVVALGDEKELLEPAA